MAELALDGSNPDVGLLYLVNGVARHCPGWFRQVVTFGAEYGVLAVLAALLAWCWWRVARRQGAGCCYGRHAAA